MSESLDDPPGGVRRDSHEPALGAVTGDDADAVIEFVARLDHDALGVRTVIVRLRAREGAVSAVAADLRGPYATEVYETTGAHNVFAVCRFANRETLDGVLTRLATDDRVESLTANVVLRTVCEYDHDALLSD